RLGGAPSTWHQQVLGACMAAGPSAAASHRSAAKLWDLPVGPEVVELTIPETRHIEVPGVIVHRSVRLERTDVRRCDGIPTTSPARTVVDLAAVLTHAELYSLLDHVLGERRISSSHLHRCLDRLGNRGRRGTRALSDLLASRPTGRRTPESTFEWRLL